MPPRSNTKRSTTVETPPGSNRNRENSPSTKPGAIHLSNALVESTNTKIRVLTRVAFGFHSAEALIALAMLSLGDHRPALPGRT
ncbi:MAG: transposase [Actinomycetes bacterium]